MNPDKELDLFSYLKNLEHCSVNIRQRISQNILKLNEHYGLVHIPLPLRAKGSVKILGVIFDRCIIMYKHVSMLSCWFSHIVIVRLVKHPPLSGIVDRNYKCHLLKISIYFKLTRSRLFSPIVVSFCVAHRYAMISFKRSSLSMAELLQLFTTHD